MYVVFLCGVHSEKSRLKSLMKEAEELFVEKGAKTHFWDVYENHLPILDPKEKKHKRAKKLDKEVKKADVVVMGTPLYHNTLSGALKNTLDHMNYDGLEDTKVGLMCTAGSVRTSALIFPHFRSVVAELRGEPVYTTVGAAMSDFEKDENGNYMLENESIKERMQQFVAEFF